MGENALNCHSTRFLINDEKRRGENEKGGTSATVLKNSETYVVLKDEVLICWWLKMVCKGNWVNCVTIKVESDFEKDL